MRGAFWSGENLCKTGLNIKYDGNAKTVHSEDNSIN